MKPPFHHRHALLLALGICTALHPTPSSAAVLRVPADHSTIQAAVNAAASGDTIQIASGLYEEQILIRRKNLIVEDAPGLRITAVCGRVASTADDRQTLAALHQPRFRRNHAAFES